MIRTTVVVKPGCLPSTFFSKDISHAMEELIEKVVSASRTSLQSGSDIDTLSEEKLEALV